jgi:glycerophosphoryl diester phosphodiesterase
MTKRIQAIWKETLNVLRKAIRPIFAIHIAYIALGVVFFAPMTGILGQFLLNFSGQSVLSDLDIAYFFLTPPGMLALILFASLLLTILVFEQASLMAVCYAAMQGQQMNVIAALFFTVRKAKKIFLFAIRLVLRVLLITLPFASLALAIAWVMITDYDINYYLATKPPVFFITVISIGMILLTLTIVLGRNLCSWSLTLPLILFSDATPAHSFTTSEQLTRDNKQLLLMTLGSWALSGILLSAVVLGSIQLLGSILAPFFFNSMTLLIPVLGGLVALWVLSNLLITTFASGSFALLLLFFYDRNSAKSTPEVFAENKTNTKTTLSVPLFAILLLTAAATSVISGIWLLKDIPADTDTMIIAHRGAAGKAPENTLSSMRHAINDGTDWLEIDVQESVDGEVVVIHDSDFMKLANNKLKVWEGTLEEIQQIDVGSWFSSEFSDERVPTLYEVLALAKGKCRVLIELKYYGYDLQLEQLVVDIVEQSGMVDEVALMSLKYEGIKKIRALRPDWTIGLLSSKAVGKISDLDVDFLAINMATAKPAFIRRIQSTGKQVYVWTVNDQASMSRMIALGVDGLITDEPALAREVLIKNKDITPIERLLLHTAVLFNQAIPSQTYRDQSP